MFFTDGSLVVSDTTFTSSSAQLGGAVAVMKASSASFTRTSFVGNNANKGGALYVQNVNTTLSVSYSSFIVST